MGSFDSLEYIDHKAVVKSVDMKNRSLILELSAAVECEGCVASKLCNPAGKQKNEFCVEVDRPSDFKVGEHVILRGTEQLHRKAMVVATVVPSIALVAVMVLIYILTANQAAAALGGIGSMIFFFVMLYLFRNRIAHEFAFTVIPESTV